MVSVDVFFTKVYILLLFLITNQGPGLDFKTDVGSLHIQLLEIIQFFVYMKLT